MAVKITSLYFQVNGTAQCTRIDLVLVHKSDTRSEAEKEVLDMLTEVLGGFSFPYQKDGPVQIAGGNPVHASLTLETSLSKKEVSGLLRAAGFREGIPMSPPQKLSPTFEE